MFGIDLASLVSGSMIQDLVRAHSQDVLALSTTLARQQMKLADGEVISFQLIEHTGANGKPTWMLFPQVLQKGTLVLLRKLPYVDVGEFLHKAPLEKWVNDGKQWRKVIEDIEVEQGKERDLRADALKHTKNGKHLRAATCTEKADAHRIKQRTLAAKLPQWVQDMLIGQGALAPAPTMKALSNE